MLHSFFGSISLLSAVVVVWLFELNIRVLSPGAYAKSRWTYGVLTLALSSCFLWIAMTGSSGSAGLAFALAALFFGLRALEQERNLDAPGFALFAAPAVYMWVDLTTLLVLPAVALLLELGRRRQWVWSASVVLLFFTVMGVLAHLDNWSLSPAPIWLDWSVFNFFKSTFVRGELTESYTLPNLAYLFYPLVHPGFCLTLPALLLLFKKTDVHLYSKRVLALSLLLFLVYQSGLPMQNPVGLLPGYVILLLLLFPAWDRFFAYGIYFFPRLAYALIGLTLLCQILFLSFMIWQ
ncbi:MAG: hypothetical protein JNJ90_13360 [Saprospiraceae bacterium]|jgi:hypothetical protein|nr:hypothetical protein [Saprospiraceae bacterium]